MILPALDCQGICRSLCGGFAFGSRQAATACDPIFADHVPGAKCENVARTETFGVILSVSATISTMGKGFRSRKAATTSTCDHVSADHVLTGAKRENVARTEILCVQLQERLAAKDS